MSNSNQDLREHVSSIADSITNPPEPYQDENGEWRGDVYEYLENVLDIEYICNSRKEYLGARVLVAFGGPNIWVNTRTETVEGYWWGSNAFASFEDNLGLDDALSELFSN